MHGAVTLKAMNRMKSNCSAESSIYELLIVHLSPAIAHACAPNETPKSCLKTTGKNNAVMTYTKSLNSSPTEEDSIVVVLCSTDRRT